MRIVSKWLQLLLACNLIVLSGVAVYLVFLRETPVFGLNLRQSVIGEEVEDEFPQYWDNIVISPWREHPAWLEYLSMENSASQTTSLHHIINDKNYCLKREEFIKTKSVEMNEISGLPVKDNWYIFTNTPKSGAFEALNMEEFATVMYQVSDDQADARDFALPISLDQFFILGQRWHWFHLLGSEFGCPSQKHNKILSTVPLGHKHVLNTLIKAYANYYADRPQCFQNFTPQTYSFSDKEDCKIAQKIVKDPANMSDWIWKRSFDGAGSSYVANFQTVNSSKKAMEKAWSSAEEFQKFPYVLQKSIKYPLLVSGKNFDLRVYVLMVSVDPLIVMYHDGFGRIPTKGENNDEILKDEYISYEELAEILMMDGVVEEESWLDSVLRPKITASLTHLIRITYPEIAPIPQTYQLFAVDFILDSDQNLYLLEINLIPEMAADDPVKLKEQSETLRGSLALPMALVYGVDLGRVMERTGYRMVYDGRQRGMEKYQGNISRDCL